MKEQRFSIRIRILARIVGLIFCIYIILRTGKGFRTDKFPSDCYAGLGDTLPLYYNNENNYWEEYKNQQKVNVRGGGIFPDSDSIPSSHD